jgi:hypothetical protein
MKESMQTTAQKESGSPKRTSWIRSALNWLRGKKSGQPPSFNFEGLESRVVMAAGPALVAVELLGSVSSVNAVVLTFNESLDPTSAQNIKAYALGHNPASTSSSGFDLSTLLFRKTNHQTPAVRRPVLVRQGKIVFSSAIYDETTHSVTLTPVGPFKAQNYFRYLRIKGIGPYAIKDDSGIALNAGLDTESRWFMRQTKSVRWVDPQHSHVTLKLTGPGKMYVFLRGNNRQPTIFIQGGTAATTLTGSVTNSRVLFPAVNIAQIQGAQGINNQLLNNNSFHIFTMTP